MGLLNLEGHLTDKDLRQGRLYANSGRVRNVTVTESLAVADVFGSRRYKTRLDWSQARQRVLRIDCSCPRFEEMGECKHIAALAFYLESRAMGPQEKVRVSEIRGFDDLPETSDEAEEVEVFESQEQLVHGMLPRDIDPRLAQAVVRQVFGYSPEAWRPEQRGKKAKQSRRSAHQPPPIPEWQTRLKQLRKAEEFAPAIREKAARSRELAILLSPVECADQLILRAYHREPRKSGELGALKELKIGPNVPNQFDDPEDRLTLALLAGGSPAYGGGYYGYGYSYGSETTSVSLSRHLWDTVLPRLSARGQLRWLSTRNPDPTSAVPVVYDARPVSFRVVTSAAEQGWVVGGRLLGEEPRDVATGDRLLAGGKLLLAGGRLAPLALDRPGDERWLAHFIQHGPFHVKSGEEQAFLEWLREFPSLPTFEAPAEWAWQERQGDPTPCISIKPHQYDARHLVGELAFDYEGVAIPANHPRDHVSDAQTGILRRDRAKEERCRLRLGELGFIFRDQGYGFTPDLRYELPAKKLPEVVAALMAENWRVEAEGYKVRRPGDFRASLVSGVDWFDLEGSFDFEGVSVELPTLLAAVRKGERFVELGDGTRGMLPEDWLARYGRLIDLGETVEGKVRFRSSQALLLDALLAAQTQVEVDEQFRAARDRLNRFDGVAPRKEPKTFRGELRGYQREGLGWLGFLEEFRLGGCLADDMGLGKTVQVLAHLAARRKTREKADEPRRPSLIVVPKSLVSNWQAEAARFAPQLKVLDYTGIERKGRRDAILEADLVVTTYGTIRNDVVQLKEIEFDYVILDEAQAVKNNSAQAAKAVRLLNGRHRLAMSGTPIENHLGELWSLFEFLNPGMLGRLEAFRRMAGTKDDSAKEQLALLARALRPYFLRRTKEQVLSELPAKTEQTLVCELGKEQRKLYDELRDHYRVLLDGKIAKQGLAKSKIHVLEALLRLRQAACHPGLLDQSRAKGAGASAKVDLLMEQLREVVDEGHKALVFSQFTSLLALVKPRLDEERIRYAYLDGQTTKRGEVVEHFQNDKDCPVFLISLKAGGLGLNLTAADYVFILDPWWNPAVEAQAVDRAHRIGQSRHVFAYRLIAKDTVEEKILALQKDKRELAEAILSADNSLISKLTAEDLRLLLS